MRNVIWAAAMMMALPWLVKSWWSFESSEPDRRALLWSSTLTWTLVLNLYVGIYDAVLLVPGVFMTTDVLCHRARGMRGTLSSGYKAMLALLFVVSWISQFMARSMRLQPLTLVIITVAAYQLILAGRVQESSGLIEVPGASDPCRTWLASMMSRRFQERAG